MCAAGNVILQLPLECGVSFSSSWTLAALVTCIGQQQQQEESCASYKPRPQPASACACKALSATVRTSPRLAPCVMRDTAQTPHCPDSQPHPICQRANRPADYRRVSHLKCDRLSLDQISRTTQLTRSVVSLITTYLQALDLGTTCYAAIVNWYTLIGVAWTQPNVPFL